MFGGWRIWILIVVALFFLIIIARIFITRKLRNHSKTNIKEKREFTKDDRRTILLIQELGDIIDTVEKRLK